MTRNHFQGTPVAKHYNIVTCFRDNTRAVVVGTSRNDRCCTAEKQERPW
jgi:hypothetical protein